MSITVHGKEITLQITEQNKPENIVQLIKDFMPLHTWAQRLDENLRVDSVEIQSIDYFGPRIGFMKIKAIIYDKELNTPVPGIVFLRGDAVAIFPVIFCENERYILVVEQYRVPIGKKVIEIPAGMCDGSGNLSGIAIKELEEETGLKLNANQLIKLGSYYPSGGGCDEQLHLFLLEHQISKQQMNMMKEKLFGEGPHERISLKFIKEEEIYALDDSKALVSYLHYLKLKKQ